MKYVLFMVLMIPLCLYMNMWFVFQFMLLYIAMIFVFSNLTIFYSSMSYMFGIDYISYGLIILTLLISSLMIISSNSIFFMFTNNFFLFINLMLCLCLLLVFSFTNMFYMYLFFEFSLIPLVILVFGWGYQPERLISGLYLFFYTLFASLPLLLMIIYYYMIFFTMFFDMNFNDFGNFFIHFCLIFAFLVKLPMFMLHFWLPKAHVEAPISGSMILAGLMLKIGGYGIIRFMFLYEYIFMNYSYIWYSLSLVGSIIVSLICLIQGDMKCLIAYSSVAHMGLGLMGLLSMTKFGLYGSYFMMIGHGFCSSGLFCLANISYERSLSRSFYINKGMMVYMPSLSLIWFLFCCFNMSCPPSINFMSEVFILNSMISYWDSSIYYIFFISFLSACFSFYLFSFSQHGKYHSLYSFSNCFVKEYLLMIIHLAPLILIVINFSLFIS
nr:NADH dehydrogenase subunit 4 [Gunungidia aurantiifasciata]